MTFEEAFGKPKQEGDSDAAPCSASSPWPMADVLAKLCEAADILLDHKSYDGHGHELIDAARKEAREYLKQNTAMRQDECNEELPR